MILLPVLLFVDMAVAQTSTSGVSFMSRYLCHVLMRGQLSKYGYLRNYDFPGHAFGVDDISTAQSVAA
jgi:hypothetical protein